MSFDWSTWQPTEQAVLCFVFRDPEVLLIEKLRGLGAGKVNAPGGRIDPGETAVQAAIRETKEEVGVDCRDVEQVGELHFQFTDGYSLLGFVFRTSVFSGDPYPTDEAIPFWSLINEIPYNRMWSDDELWLPHLIANEPFLGRFEFDGDKMLSQEVLTGVQLDGYRRANGPSTPC